MKLELSQAVATVGIGLGASVMMDGWNALLKRMFGMPSLNYCLLGRWLRHMPDGTFRHASINNAGTKSFECPVGWLAHYSIGVTFAAGLVALMSTEWLRRPTFLPAFLFGVVTVVFPFFLMQPALGLGIAASRTPNPAVARLKSLATHTVFGLGLYLCALVASRFL
jgi:hypothetical protein